MGLFNGSGSDSRATAREEDRRWGAAHAREEKLSKAEMRANKEAGKYTDKANGKGK